MGVTIHKLAHDFDLSVHTIRKYVKKGILPAPEKKGGPDVPYDPVCIKILAQLRYNRDYLHATLDELAERRQATGQLLPDPDGPRPPVIARGSV